MTTSGSIDFSLTRNELIRYALLLCNGIEENEAIGATQLADANRTLNIFIKKINTRKPLWGFVDFTIPLYDSKQAYTLGSGADKNINRPLTISQARRVIGSIETSIDIVSRHEYMDQPNKPVNGEANMVYYDPQLTTGKLYVWPTGSAASTSLSDGSTNNWTVSATATEYYYTGSDITAEPAYVFIKNGSNMVEMTEGTAGSLAAYQYAWGDNDTLGADTLYVYSATDPDATTGSVKVLTSTPSRLIITVNRTLEDFDSAADTPDFPQESYEMLAYNLAYRLSPMYDSARTGFLKAMADEYTNDFLSHDSEHVNLTIQPRFK